MQWYLKTLKNYTGFNERARRKEYWMFVLVQTQSGLNDLQANKKKCFVLLKPAQ